MSDKTQKFLDHTTTALCILGLCFVALKLPPPVILTPFIITYILDIIGLIISLRHGKPVIHYFISIVIFSGMILLGMITYAVR